jgi:hypothetical protein
MSDAAGVLKIRRIVETGPEAVAELATELGYPGGAIKST